jgi:hypothetical protein
MSAVYVGPAVVLMCRGWTPSTLQRCDAGSPFFDDCSQFCSDLNQLACACTSWRVVVGLSVWSVGQSEGAKRARGKASVCLYIVYVLLFTDQGGQQASRRCSCRPHATHLRPRYCGVSSCCRSQDRPSSRISRPSLHHMKIFSTRRSHPLICTISRWVRPPCPPPNRGVTRLDVLSVGAAGRQRVMGYNGVQ